MYELVVLRLAVPSVEILLRTTMFKKGRRACEEHENPRVLIREVYEPPGRDLINDRGEGGGEREKKTTRRKSTRSACCLSERFRDQHFKETSGGTGQLKWQIGRRACEEHENLRVLLRGV